MSHDTDNHLSIQAVIDSMEQLVIIVDENFRELKRNAYANTLLGTEKLGALLDEEEQTILRSAERFEFQKTTPQDPSKQLKWISKKIDAQRLLITCVDTTATSQSEEKLLKALKDLNDQKFALDSASIRGAKSVPALANR